METESAVGINEGKEGGEDRGAKGRRRGRSCGVREAEGEKGSEDGGKKEAGERQ